MPNYYDALGVRKTDRPATIKKAYRRLAAQFHPDRNPGDEGAVGNYRGVTEAYEVLSDPARRKRYDETGDGSRVRSGDQQVVLAALAVHLQAVLQDTVRFGGVRTTDILAKVKQRLKDDQTNCREQKKGLEKALAGFKEAAGRFTTTGPENVLDEFVQAQATMVEGQLANCNEAIDKIEKAQEFLKAYSYRTDGKPSAAQDLGSLLGTRVISFTV